MPMSPRHLRRNVQHLGKGIQDAVSEQVRDLPIHAVRLAMFGVGRALLLSDRVNRDVKEIRESGVGPVLGRLRDDAQRASTELAGKVVGKVVERVNGSDTATEAPAREETPVARPPRRTASAPSEIVVGKPNAKAPASKLATEAKPAAAAKPSPAPKAAPTARATAPAKPAATTAKPKSEPTVAAKPKPAATADPKPSAAKSAATADPKASPAKPKPSPARSAVAADPKASSAKSEPKAAAPKPAPAAPLAAEPLGAEAVTAEPAQPIKAEPAKPGPLTARPIPNADKLKPAELPVPDYDSATLASVRARLRALTAPQVSKLREYEAAHQNRADFLRMFDNRLNKLANLS